MLALLLPFLRANWKPIAVGLLAVGAVIYHFGAVKYAHYKGYQEATAEWQIKEQAWQQEVTKWNAQVDRLTKEVEEAKAKKNEVVKRNFDMFKESKKKQTVKKTEVQNEIKQAIKPADVVVVPSAFVELHNDAVKGTGSPNGSESEARPPADSSRTVGQVSTFDATTFTQVIISNVLQYNELAVRCDALIDIVNELEDVENDNDSKRLVQPAGPDGGDPTLGTSAIDLTGLG